MATEEKNEHIEFFRFRLPKVIKIGKYEIPRKRAVWLSFYTCTVIGLFALVIIIIATQVYIHSFDIRVDCNPDLPLNYHNCLERGCIWVQRANDFEPPCFFPDGYGYRSVDIKNTSNGYRVNLRREPDTTIFGDEVDSVDLMVFFETEKRIRLKFVDRNRIRYEVPLEVPAAPSEAPKQLNYSVEFVNEPQFGIRVKRISTGQLIFDTNVPGMVISNQFLQITTRLASSFVYGLGEHFTAQYKHSTKWKKWSFFARDEPPTSDSNLYGVHPFYMNLEDDGNAHGVFLLNSNAMEVILQPSPALTFRTIGGILDFYIFLGPTPEEVVQQYLQVVGLPMMPPYWSLGFQLSRFGYKSVEDVEKLVQRTMDNNIPHDVQYFDIDYMKDFRSFTVDENKFKNLKGFIERLHEKGIKVVMILNPFIASNKTLKDKYPPLDVGENRHIFIKVNGSNLEGKCWPGKVFYADFSHPEVKPYWSQMCTEFRKAVQFDGLWIDMNEPANFVDGSLTGCTNNSLNYPPYAVGVSHSGKNKLYEKTICMDADQYAGKHYDVHSLYGFFQSNVTYRTLSIISSGNRPMVLSRSTFPGSGKFAAHWLGDNLSTWPQLRASIPGMLEFNLFGIPLVGADICGFWLNTTEELCARWMQLGAFYPLSRNHNANDTKDQDPASLGETVIAAARTALQTRYELLPYLYTLFRIVHTQGGTVARPLLHEFPNDSNTWSIDYQFLWGPALLISPVVHKDVNFVEAYFPKGIWYYFYSGKAIVSDSGMSVTLLDEGRINLHVRGGFILPLQQPNLTTATSHKQPMGLFVAPDGEDSANGQLFWDDGISSEVQERKGQTRLQFRYEKKGESVEISSVVVVNAYHDAQSITFDYMVVCKQSAPPSSITYGAESIDSSKWQYNEDEQMLRLDGLAIPIAEKFSLIINY